MKKGIVVQDNGKIRTVEDIELAEEIIKKRKNKNPWQVIEYLVHLWAKRTPDDVEAMRINVTQYRETQRDKKFARTLGGEAMERRFTLAFPRSLMLLIRTQYKADELPFDSNFYREFAQRFPVFKVAEKI